MVFKVKNFGKDKPADTLQQGLVNTFIQDGDSDVWNGRSQSVDYSYYNPNRRNGKWCKPAYIPTFVLLLLIVLVVLLPLLDSTSHSGAIHRRLLCQNSCKLELVESIPVGMSYSSDAPVFQSTYSRWSELLNMSTSSVDIASFYWTLKSSDVVSDPSSDLGNEIFESIKAVAKEKNVKVRIAQNMPTRKNPNLDTEELKNLKLAEVRSLNFTALMGAGVLHTKFWVIDKKHFYVGSANMDWRSLTQVKELGIVGYNCPCLASDLTKIFLVYWSLGGQTSIPDTWPDSLATGFNVETPAEIISDDVNYKAYISSSPKPFNPQGRTNDLDAVLNTIRSADEYINIAVMDYYPAMIYTRFAQFWPDIDNELRRAFVDRRVSVRILVSKWPSTRLSLMVPFLKSLIQLKELHVKPVIEVKMFVVPSNASYDHIPFSRVNHNKYMVTDKTALIGTSNWSGDYFTNTGGVSLVLTSPNTTDPLSIHAQLYSIFERDWMSDYASNIDDILQ